MALEGRIGGPHSRGGTNTLPSTEAGACLTNGKLSLCPVSDPHHTPLQVLTCREGNTAKLIFSSKSYWVPSGSPFSRRPSGLGPCKQVAPSKMRPSFHAPCSLPCTGISRAPIRKLARICAMQGPHQLALTAQHNIFSTWWISLVAGTAFTRGISTTASVAQRFLLPSRFCTETHSLRMLSANCLVMTQGQSPRAC